MKSLTYFLISSSIVMASDLSFQGYTGLINTPNAQIIKDGDTIFHFNNQFDNNLRDYNYSKDVNSEENYIFGIGFLPSLEIVGRVVEAEEILRDLSANIKYKLPYKSDYLPDIAIGIQDIGGAYSFYDNKYIVADKKFSMFRASLGYGKSGSNIVKSKRMDGIFGGVEAKVTNWLSILAENDTKENHIGVRIGLPKSYLSSFNLNALIAKNLTNSDTSFGINLSIPLNKRKEIKRLKYKNSDKYQNIEVKNDNKKIIKRLKNSIKKDEMSNLISLQEKLVDFGFENVRVGEYGDGVIYVECENSIFDKNDLDALGYITGTVVNSNLKYNYFTVTLLKNNIQTVSINGTLLSFKRYIKNPTPENYYKVKNSLIINKEFDTSKVKFITKKQNSSFFKPIVELSPGVITTVGTEIGLFDYLLSLRSNVYMPLYNGLSMSAMYELPFVNSKNFDDGEILNKMYSNRVDSRLVNANLHQSFHYSTLFNTTTIGKFKTDYYGVLNQTNISLSKGEHALNFMVGTFINDNNENDTHTIYEGNYRYYYQPLDIFAKVAYGEYWYEDKGVTLELKRFFGDTAISLEYQNLENQYIGLKVSMPLTFRKIAKASSFGQIKGKSDFNYGVRSTIHLDDGTNRLIPSGGVLPTVDFKLDSYYLNRDRLNSSYILGHINRMREAYLDYK